MWWQICAVLVALGIPGLGYTTECDNPDADWLFCEDFERGAMGLSDWFAQSPFVECLGCDDDGRMRLDNNTANIDEGQWSMHMPAAASSGYRGGSLVFRSCRDEKRPGCNPLIGHDRLYYRAWVKLAEEHRYVHHFMSIGGTRPGGYWEGDGNAGCRPNGYRSAGSALDFRFDDNRGEHGLFFYTYFPEMNCDDIHVGNGYCGRMQPRICDECAAKDMPCEGEPECCWGNHFSADPHPILPRDRWVCLEMMLQLNTPGASDGEMAFWVDEQLGHRQTGMHWRDVPELQLNKIRVQHYIAEGDTDQSNPIWWDNVIVSTSRINCGQSQPADGGTVADRRANDLAMSSDEGQRADRPAVDHGTPCVPRCLDDRTLESCDAEGTPVTLTCGFGQRCQEARCIGAGDAGKSSDEQQSASACNCQSAQLNAHLLLPFLLLAGRFAYTRAKRRKLS